ncbi:tyrosine-protein phosphatase non-receptor type 23 [Aphelenchoides avenae]|nr:tyrosine-protein phosphatase non-receptor type 23 [Aphelenchus avenae]
MELQKHDKVVKLLEQNMVAQENILRALTEANANFADLRRQIVEGNESRAEKSLALISAYQVYVDVREKTSKALIFYEQLFKRAAQLEKLVGIMESACKQVPDYSRTL